SRSGNHLLENGTPQGSILSPLLFIIMLNGLPNPVGNIRVSIYADDIAFWTMGTDLRSMTKNMQIHLDRANEYLLKNGFKVSDTKTQSILFSNKCAAEDFQLFLSGAPLQRTTSVTFLGMIDLIINNYIIETCVCI
ncbi:reverse transcriptase domain-containing protein, partial [Staphylococcus aureus]